MLSQIFLFHSGRGAKICRPHHASDTFQSITVVNSKDNTLYRPEAAIATKLAWNPPCWYVYTWLSLSRMIHSTSSVH